MAERPALLVGLTRGLARTEATQPLASRLIAALSTTLEMDGGAITIGHGTGQCLTLAATDHVAARVEELQRVLREGPSLDAVRTRRPVAESLREQGRRWPTLSQSLRERHEAIRLHAVPVTPDGRVVGVVSLYRLSGGRPEFDRDGAQFLADAVGVAIFGRVGRSDPTGLVWSPGDRLHQATGMVVAQLRISPVDAVALLRAHAFAQGVALADVAEGVVARRIDFRDPDSSEGRSR
jgi:hypothetical protein